MESQSSDSLGRTEQWIALALCAGALLSRAMEHLVAKGPAYAQSFGPDWLPIAAIGFAAAGIMRLDGSPRWLRLQRALLWSGFLLVIWGANGLPFDLLTMAGLIGGPATGRPASVDWQGLTTRTLALAAAFVLARLALARPAASASTRVASWYGYAAFVLALPYPVLRTHWALGGTLGLSRPGAACWVMVTTLASGRDTGVKGIAVWVPCLFYGSWLLFAIAEGAATRSYQLRSAALRMSSPT